MGALHPADFKEWLPFVTCMRDAMQLIEGQAYFPEAKITKEILTVGYQAKVFTELPPYSDNGTEEGQEVEGDEPLAGKIIGASNYANNHAQVYFFDFL